MTRYGASTRTLSATVACVLLSASVLHAQRSPDKDWAILQLYRGGHTPRVTVRTASGEATGKLRAVEPDRLTFGDRASHPIILARAEICEVFTSRHQIRPRTEAISIAIGGGLIAVVTVLAKGVGIRGRIFGASGLSYVLLAKAKTTTPAYPLYSNPAACAP